MSKYLCEWCAAPASALVNLEVVRYETAEREIVARHSWQLCGPCNGFVGTAIANAQDHAWRCRVQMVEPPPPDLFSPIHMPIWWRRAWRRLTFWR